MKTHSMCFSLWEKFCILSPFSQSKICISFSYTKQKLLFCYEAVIHIWHVHDEKFCGKEYFHYGFCIQSIHIVFDNDCLRFCIESIYGKWKIFIITHILQPFATISNAYWKLNIQTKTNLLMVFDIIVNIHLYGRNHNMLCKLTLIDAFICIPNNRIQFRFYWVVVAAAAVLVDF